VEIHALNARLTALEELVELLVEQQGEGRRDK
jgi:hypothetical protein